MPHHDASGDGGGRNEFIFSSMLFPWHSEPRKASTL